LEGSKVAKTPVPVPAVPTVVSPLPEGASPTVVPAAAAVKASETIEDAAAALAGLTLRQRRFTIKYAEGAGRRGAVRESYNVTTAQSADEMAKQLLAHPKIQLALKALQHHNGLTSGALKLIHGAYLAKFDSPDPVDRSLGLKAVDLGYRMAAAYTKAQRAVTEAPRTDDFAGWTEAELEAFAVMRTVPARFADRFLVGNRTTTWQSEERREATTGTPPTSETPRAEDAAQPAWSARGDTRWQTTRRPAEARPSIDTVDTASTRSAPLAAGASSSAHGDYIGAPAPVFGHDRVYDPQATPSTTPAGPINARFAADAETARRDLARDDELLRALRRQAADPLLRDLANSDRRW
jgi:hypothetical protein